MEPLAVLRALLVAFMHEHPLATVVIAGAVSLVATIQKIRKTYADGISLIGDCAKTCLEVFRGFKSLIEAIKAVDDARTLSQRLKAWWGQTFKASKDKTGVVMAKKAADKASADPEFDPDPDPPPLGVALPRPTEGFRPHSGIDSRGVKVTLFWLDGGRAMLGRFVDGLIYFIIVVVYHRAIVPRADADLLTSEQVFRAYTAIDLRHHVGAHLRLIRMAFSTKAEAVAIKAAYSRDCMLFIDYRAEALAIGNAAVDLGAVKAPTGMLARLVGVDLVGKTWTSAAKATGLRAAQGAVWLVGMLVKVRWQRHGVALGKARAAAATAWRRLVANWGRRHGLAHRLSDHVAAVLDAKTSATAFAT